MFIETYHDDRATVPGITSEPMIPYPELSGEELEVWRKYLPMRRQIRNLDSRLNGETIPAPVITELEKAKKASRLFDRIEIWSRTDDPMAVGIIGKEKTALFFYCALGGCRHHVRAGEKETAGREMDALVDFNSGDLGFSRRHVGCPCTARVEKSGPGLAMWPSRTKEFGEQLLD